MDVQENYWNNLSMFQNTYKERAQKDVWLRAGLLPVRKYFKAIFCHSLGAICADFGLNQKMQMQFPFKGNRNELNLIY